MRPSGLFVPAAAVAAAVAGRAVLVVCGLPSPVPAGRSPPPVVEFPETATRAELHSFGPFSFFRELRDDHRQAGHR